MKKNTATVLWIDLTLNGCSRELQQWFGRHCDIRRAGEVSVANASPHLICFEYDYPDRAGLQLLQQTKQRYPSIPILMATLQHSEALAVWAFRTRVWDYLVKPSAPAEIDRVCSALSELTELRAGSHLRKPLKGATALPTEVRFFGETDRQEVRPAIEYIHSHFAEKISETTVAALCGMNRFQFSRAFSKTQGITFNDYLIGHRIREACRLFQNPTISVTDVALMVGFSDVSHFGRMFKRYCGVLPSTYRAGVAQRPESATDELQAKPRSALRYAGEPRQRDLLEPTRLSLSLSDK